MWTGGTAAEGGALLAVTVRLGAWVAQAVRCAFSPGQGVRVLGRAPESGSLPSGGRPLRLPRPLPPLIHPPIHSLSPREISKIFFF